MLHRAVCDCSVIFAAKVGMPRKSVMQAKTHRLMRANTQADASQNTQAAASQNTRADASQNTQADASQITQADASQITQADASQNKQARCKPRQTGQMLLSKLTSPAYTSHHPSNPEFVKLLYQAY